MSASNSTRALSEQDQSADAVRVRNLARVLRGVGAAVLLAAASTFLVQHWHDAGDVTRYLGLLGLTGLLACAGLLVGVGMRESRSARTFLALAAATVPAHFAIAGGLLYSQWVQPGSGLPTARYALWQAPSGATALAVAALSLAVLVPIVQIAFTALARARARHATALLFAIGATMWVPLRDPFWSTLLLAGVCAVLGGFEMRVLRRAPGLRTVEGVLLRLVLGAPAVLIALRSLLHYESSWFLISVIGGGGAVLATALALEARVPRPWRLVAEGAAISAAAITTGSLALGVDQLVPITGSARLLILGLPFAASLFALAALVPERRGAFANSASGVALGTVALDFLLFGGEASALFALVVGIGALADGFLRERRLIVGAGAATAALGLGTQVIRAAAHYAWDLWGALAALGIGVIVAAALLERHHVALRERAVSLRARCASWEY